MSARQTLPIAVVDRDWEERETVSLVAKWNGYDSRWYYRQGGRRDGTAWTDRFTAPNPAMSLMTIAQQRDYFDLDRGSYRIKWDAHLVFANPACEEPSENYLAIGVRGTRLSGGNAFFLNTWISEVYVCARRNGLVYEHGLVADFELRQRSTGINFSLLANNDGDSGRQGYTNCREVIVYSMELTKSA